MPNLPRCQGGAPGEMKKGKSRRPTVAHEEGTVCDPRRCERAHVPQSIVHRPGWLSGARCSQVSQHVTHVSGPRWVGNDVSKM
jgi:hypothetical protein